MKWIHAEQASPEAGECLPSLPDFQEPSDSLYSPPISPHPVELERDILFMPKAVQGPPGFIFLPNYLTSDACRAYDFQAPTTDHQRLLIPQSRVLPALTSDAIDASAGPKWPNAGR